MFGILLVSIFLALSVWTLIALYRRLVRQHLGTGWWLVFGGSVVGGILLGVWFALSFEYHFGPNHRIGGFPLPVVFFHLESGQWIDFPVPEFQMWATVLTNIISITALVMLPLWLATWRHHKSDERDNM